MFDSWPDEYEDLEEESYEIPKAAQDVPYEPLEPELQESITRSRTSNQRYIYHPLLITQSYVSNINKRYNDIFRYRKRQLAIAIQERNWGRAVSLHERPFRLNIFESYIDQMTDMEYWQALRATWRGTRQKFEHRKTWERLMTSDRSHRTAMMTVNEQTMLSQLLDEVGVWRGTTDNEEDRGLSWVLEPDRARIYARRTVAVYEGDPMLVEGRVKREDILGLFINELDEETEIVAKNVSEVHIHCGAFAG